jgi:hypothetical protein
LDQWCLLSTFTGERKKTTTRPKSCVLIGTPLETSIANSKQAEIYPNLPKREEKIPWEEMTGSPPEEFRAIIEIEADRFLLI